MSGHIDGNSVYAGNPTKKNMSIEDYTNKRNERQLNKALAVFKAYYDRYERIPPEEIFHDISTCFQAKQHCCHCLRKNSFGW